MIGIIFVQGREEEPAYPVLGHCSPTIRRFLIMIDSLRLIVHFLHAQMSPVTLAETVHTLHSHSTIPIPPADATAPAPAAETVAGAGVAAHLE